MTNALHIPAQAGVPIACDMSTAEDTPDERLAEYGRLFERALVRRERGQDAVVFVFRAEPEVSETVESLARREAACCPFLEFRVEAVGGEVVYEMSRPAASGEQPAEVDAILDALYALPDHAGSDMAGLLVRLADNGVEIIQATPER
jgi:hypothetical protein